MYFVSAVEEIRRLEDGGDWGKIVDLTEMLKAFPDLRLFRDHWGRTLYCSKEVNGEVHEIEIEPCSLCDHAVKVFAYGVIDPKGTRIYADPPYLIVGRQNQKGFGVVPVPDWEQRYEAEGFDRLVIREVRDYLAGNPPINYIEE
jgi:hypothetical protein